MQPAPMTDIGGLLWVLVTFALLTPACEAILIFMGWIVHYFADPR